MRHCYEIGIDYFDTARGYTVSEERAGKALEHIRDGVYLAAKSRRKIKDELLKELDISFRDQPFCNYHICYGRDNRCSPVLGIRRQRDASNDLSSQISPLIQDEFDLQID